MKSIMLKDKFGLSNITLEEQEIPTIKNTQVLIKVDSISLNQLDIMIAEGIFSNNLPHVLGSDASGVIVKLGSDVTKFKLGDKVVSHFIQKWKEGEFKSIYATSKLGTNLQGVFAEYIVLEENDLIKIPSNLTLEEAATLPIAALAAWEALFVKGELKQGQTVLLQGTGGVAIFALQFAKAIGAKVIQISSSDNKLEFVKKLGADETINYTTNTDWDEKVLNLTNNDGVDLVLEMSWKDLNKSINTTKTSGKISVVGLLGGENTNVSIFGILQKSISIYGIQTGSLASFNEMKAFIEEHNIHPIIDTIFKLEDYKEAFQYFNSAKHIGKIVIKYN